MSKSHVGVTLRLKCSDAGKCWLKTNKKHRSKSLLSLFMPLSAFDRGPSQFSLGHVLGFPLHDAA